MADTPPPLFKQGPSALARLVVFVLLALGLFILDARYRSVEALRRVIGAGLYPVQRAALAPREIVRGVSSFFVSLSALYAENRTLQTQRLKFALAAQQTGHLAAENAHLRALLHLNARQTAQTTLAEVQYDLPNPFTQKLVIDKGVWQGIQAGAPVMNEAGVVGQVTRVYPAHAEVTLLVDKDQAIPVQSVRSGVRSVIYGTPRGDALRLRFVPVNADIQPGDALVTSGLDGVFPPGLAVAKVVKIERQGESGFTRVICAPAARVRNTRQLLVLHYQDPAPLAAAHAAHARSMDRLEPSP
ncbi:Cell wall structural complex MreBCD (Rod shape-determining protein mreC) [Candidatus Glomeribacter gigasporarum BEG34]|uniref:Cell shape-determining protein MreC n=2 Tax=Candidatus Glomeribacter gigasporarum TaxID=132144 RepID=G2J7I0_9BURK|nr:Cell wall structural complex MreBCD (Rod shape-determining protein mreC) [Candidatus Glomeribacter gigasporarum BEG34]